MASGALKPNLAGFGFGERFVKRLVVFGELGEGIARGETGGHVEFMVEFEPAGVFLLLDVFEVRMFGGEVGDLIFLNEIATRVVFGGDVFAEIAVTGDAIGVARPLEVGEAAGVVVMARAQLWSVSLGI